MCTVLLPPGDNQIAVNKCIINNISYAFSFTSSCYISRPFNPHRSNHVTRSSNQESSLASCLQPLVASSLASPDVLLSTIFWRGLTVRPERFEVRLIRVLNMSATCGFRACVGAFGWDAALQAGRSRVRFLMSLISFRPHSGPRDDSASNRTE